MMPGEDFGRGVHVGMLVEESANVTREHPVFGLTGRIQRNRRLAVGVAYLLPARFAFGDKGWKLGLRLATALQLVWYGNSVTRMCIWPRLPSSMVAVARILMLPRPVR